MASWMDPSDFQNKRKGDNEGPLEDICSQPQLQINRLKTCILKHHKRTGDGQQIQHHMVYNSIHLTNYELIN